MLKNKSAKIAILLLIIGIGSWIIYLLFKPDSGKNLYVEVKQGDFEINVFTTGELEAKNSVKIAGPQQMQSMGIYQVKIQDLIAEGTVVKKGDYIGSLDKTDLAGKLKDAYNEVQKYQSQLEQAKLDTALQLRQMRDEMVNLEFGLKEKEITLEQSAYEPPATIKQVQLDLDKSKRTLEQTRKNYIIKRNQLIAKVQEVAVSLLQMQDKMDRLTVLEQSFTITAPEGGMLIYDKEWNGQKKIAGSTISAWDPTVATLPDLSMMLSKTYVNEVDIRKIKPEQEVSITLDAYPEKKLSGKITSVANVGEQSPKNDSKVFEVIIKVKEKDTTLRPAMTTGNNILIGKIPNVLFVPLECIHTDENSVSFVFLKNGLSTLKKEVKIGETNENFAVIKDGIKKGDQLFLSTPEKAKEMPLERLNKSANK
ncbi:MAG: efflux RND transporter periplasmic adaptor subunit [Bacteroidia bacterium]